MPVPPRPRNRADTCPRASYYLSASRPLTNPRTERKLELYIIVDIFLEWWTSLYDGHTISEPAFGMFRFTGREIETTSQWELGVGDSETSVRLSRGRVEAEIDFPARDSLPRGVTRWCESAMAKVLEGILPREPRSRRPDSGRQPRGQNTFGCPRLRTQPRAAGQSHRPERKTTLHRTAGCTATRSEDWSALPWEPSFGRMAR